jgi:putative hemolysin
MLDATAPFADSLIAAHLDMHTRFPVTERAGDPQRIVGYANFKDIVAVLRLSPSEPSLRGITRPLLSFAETDTIAQCLERLLRDNAHIALVRDANGTVVGLITLEDVVEELLGDITDEYDRPPDHVIPSGPSWAVGGGATLARLKEATGLDLGGEPAAMLADWCAAVLGRAPRGGDVLTRNGVRVAVRKVRRNRLLEAVATRA